MLGMTWAATLDGALDEISRLKRDKADALDALTAHVREHPEAESDEHLLNARLALL